MCITRFNDSRAIGAEQLHDGVDRACGLDFDPTTVGLCVRAVAGSGKGANLPGVTMPIDRPVAPYEGVQSIMAPPSAVDLIDNLNKDLLLALRRGVISGNMELEITRSVVEQVRPWSPM
jgi:hypothetical protein